MNEVDLHIMTTMHYNSKVIKKAENMINSFLDNNDDNHKAWVYLVNPDGTKIRIQKGCKLESYEAAIFDDKRQQKPQASEEEI